MLMEQTLQDLRAFKLTGMANALTNQLEQPKSYDLSFEERLSLLVEAEKIDRKDKRLERLMKAGKLRHNACIEDIDYSLTRGIKKEQISSLFSCQWIRESFNLLITGSTGTGKSWLGCAFGQQACRQGLSVLYIRFSLLLEKIRLSRVDGTYAKLLLNENDTSPRPQTITEKAVETHISNIVAKIKDDGDAHYDSRRIIKKYVSEYPQYKLLKKHGENLLKEAAFFKVIKDFNSSVKTLFLYN